MSKEKDKLDEEWRSLVAFHIGESWRKWAMDTYGAIDVAPLGGMGQELARLIYDVEQGGAVMDSGSDLITMHLRRDEADDLYVEIVSIVGAISSRQNQKKYPKLISMKQLLVREMSRALARPEFGNG